MQRFQLGAVLATAMALVIVGTPLKAQQTQGYNPQRNAYFGETHMHTAFSLDAYIGGTRMMASDVCGRPGKCKQILFFGEHVVRC